MQESHNSSSSEQELISVGTETSSASNTGNTVSDSVIESTPSLEQLLRDAELKAAEHHDAWLRAKADAENIRKRAQADIASAHKYAIEKFSVELLAVMDSLDAALAVENVTLENFRNGKKKDALFFSMLIGFLCSLSNRNACLCRSSQIVGSMLCSLLSKKPPY